MQVYNDELYHYGKTGMHWGHHKSNISTSQNKAEKTNKKQSATPKARLNKQEAAKWTTAAIAAIGAQKIASSVLVNSFGIDGLPRFVASHVVGSMAANSVYDMFENKKQNKSK